MNLRTTLLSAAMVSAATIGPSYAQDFELGEVLISHPWSRATPATAQTGAGYMTISNNGAESDTLVEFSSPIASRIEVHEMTMDGTIMRMRPVPQVEISPGESVELKPGGLHLMMMGLQEPLVQGQSVPVTLRFEHAGQITVELGVEGMGASAAGADHTGHGQQN